MQSIQTSDARGPYPSRSRRGAGRAARPWGPALPQEPEEPTSLDEAELWLGIYDRYVQKVTELARDEDVEGELQHWIERCARRRRYWARTRDRLQRLEARRQAGAFWTDRLHQPRLKSGSDGTRGG